MDEKLKQVVRSLHEKTWSGKLAWDDISSLSGGDEYRVKLGNSIIEVRSGYRDDYEDAGAAIPATRYHRMLVLNSKGFVVDECDQTPADDDFQLLGSLVEAARGNARKREDTLDQLLRLLAK